MLSESGDYMLKSCSTCGKLHKFNEFCPQQIKNRQEYFKKIDRTKYKNRYERTSDADKFRNTTKWRQKRTQIQKRDCYMCRYCFLIEKKITTGESVHHIVPLAEDYNKRLDDGNLITLCRRHHEQAESGTISAKQLQKLIDEPLRIPPSVQQDEISLKRQRKEAFPRRKEFPK